MSQAHSKFKVFISTPLADDRLSPEVCAAVSAYVAESKVAPKSVGIEFLEGPNKLVLSLGYRDDEPSFPVDLQCVPLGKLELTPEAVETALSSAASAVPNVICHEFYVGDEGDFFLVLMSEASS